MEKEDSVFRKIIVIISIIVLIVAIGLAGSLDSDEYIEVNSTPRPQILN